MAKKYKYFWEKKIDKIVSNIIFLEDGTEKVLSDKQLVYLITDEPKDATSFRDLVVDNVVPDCMKVIQEHNIRKWDFHAIITSMTWSYNDAFLKAIGKAFGTYEEWGHPESFPENVTIIDIQSKLDS